MTEMPDTDEQFDSGFDPEEDRIWDGERDLPMWHHSDDEVLPGYSAP